MSITWSSGDGSTGTSSGVGEGNRGGFRRIDGPPGLWASVSAIHSSGMSRTFGNLLLMSRIAARRFWSCLSRSAACCSELRVSGPKKLWIPRPLPLPIPEPEAAAAGAVGRGVDDEREEGGEEGRSSGDRLFLFGDRLRRRDEPYDVEEDDEEDEEDRLEDEEEDELDDEEEDELDDEEEDELDDEEEDELDDEEDELGDEEDLALEVDCALAAVGAAGLKRKRSISPVTFCFFGAPLVVAGVARFFPLLFPFPFPPLPLRWRGKE